MLAAPTLVGCVLMLFAPPAGEAATAGARERGPAETTTPEHRFLVGVEAVGTQVPALRPYAVELDQRYVGNSVTMAGVGVLVRHRPVPRVSVELSLRSGSARYRLGDDQQIAHDLGMADLGVVLWAAHGKGGRVGFDAGVGGTFNAVRYQLDAKSAQIFGFGHVRMGAAAELSLRRFVFLFSVRAYGTFTNGHSSNSGPLFAGAQDAQAPIPHLQLVVAGSLGLGYRF